MCVCVCTVATATSTNDTASPIIQREDQICSVICPREPCSSSPREYSGMAGWQRTSEVLCVKMKRQKEEGRGRGRLA